MAKKRKNAEEAAATAEPGSKVGRILSITIEPHTPGEFALTFKDVTTTSKAGRRHGAYDKFSKMDQGGADDGGSVLEAIGLVFAEFAESLDDYEEGQLFSEDREAAPRLDPEA